MPIVDVDGLRLNVEESGTGDPLILVHGSWDERHVWALIEHDLAQRFRVVSYDRRGHGGSEDGAQPGSRRNDEGDLASLITTLDLAPRTSLATRSEGRSRSALPLAGPNSSKRSACTSRL